jgi:rhodanese-related sulfurtransferase
MSAPFGNRNAARPAEVCRSSYIHMRIARNVKARWVRAAYPGGLSAWIERVCQAAAAVSEEHDRDR